MYFKNIDLTSFQIVIFKSIYSVEEFFNNSDIYMENADGKNHWKKKWLNWLGNDLFVKLLGVRNLEKTKLLGNYFDLPGDIRFLKTAHILHNEDFRIPEIK